MGDDLDIARKFNEAVESTAVVGALISKVSDTNDRVARMEPKLDHVVSSMDRFGGAIAVVATGASIIVSAAVGLAWHWIFPK